MYMWPYYLFNDFAISFTYTAIKNHFEVTEYLLDLKEADIHHLGLALGLDHRHFKSMSGSYTFLDDMIYAWLKKEYQVRERGVPTWETLVMALRHRRVNQTGVAEKIETEKLNVTKWQLLVLM